MPDPHGARLSAGDDRRHHGPRVLQRHSARDELCGLITATALVQPGKTLAEVTADSVLRKMKKKEFARSVNREEIEEGARELGIPLEEHVAFTLAALQAQA